MFLLSAPIAFFRWLTEFSLKRLSSQYQPVIFVIWGLLLAAAVALIATERTREWLFDCFQEKIGRTTPFIYSLNLLMIALMFFSALTYILVERGVLKFCQTAGTTVSQSTIADFYLWHFLDAVPLLKVNETFHWKEPLTYDSGGTAFVLLLFKLVVIGPVIAAFALYWKRVEGKVEKK